jgi:hypothetical protein
LTKELEQLNHAKGRLTTILERSLDQIIYSLTLANCTCSKDNLKGYLRELIRLKVFPFRDTLRRGRSVNNILKELEKFSFEPKPESCGDCHQPTWETYDQVVKIAQKITRENFNGLCLDCMDRKKPKMSDEDWDYWMEQMREKRRWDQDCRIRHGESTWHHSFYARREKETRQPSGV